MALLMLASSAGARTMGLDIMLISARTNAPTMTLRLLSTVLASLALLPCLAQEQRTLTHGGIERQYILYVPELLPQDVQPPLVFVLHGFTQSAESIMNYSGFNAIADAEGFVLAYANGVGNGWNTNSGFPGGSTADDVGYISALTDVLHDELDVDTTRVYSCGFSAGGFMSHRLACELGYRIRAIAAVGGTMSSAAFNACTPATQVPVLHIHGTSDAVVSYGGGFANVAVEEVMGLWAERNGCDAAPVITALADTDPDDNSTVERHVYGGCADDADTELLKVLSGGPTWPSALGTSGVGNTNRDISASDEIWAFFNRFGTGALSVTSVQPAQMVAWPNPTAGPLHLPQAGADGLRWSITDLAGRDMGAGVRPMGDTVLDVSDLPRGLYLLHLETGGSRHAQRLVVGY